MLRLNQSYGHRKILLAYAGYRDRPVHAFLQHGWTLTPDAGGGRYASSDFFRGAPRVFWSRRQADEARQAGIPHVRAVGAPFLYLAVSHGCSSWTRRGDVDGERVLVYTPHSTKLGAAAACLAPLESVARAVASGRAVTVCLHPVDADDETLVRAYERVGCHVIRHGRDLYDQSHLDRQLASLLSHDVVWAFDLGSAPMYASATGTPVEFCDAAGRRGPLPSPDAFGGRVDVHERLLAAGSFPAFARSELGADLLAPPEEIVDLLGVRGFRSVEARALRRAGRAQALFRTHVLRDVTASG